VSIDTKGLREKLEKASQRPWAIRKERGDRHVDDALGVSLASDTPYYPWTFEEDDTELIVAAVNALEYLLDLIAAGEALYDSIGSHQAHFDPTGRCGLGCPQCQVQSAAREAWRSARDAS
jgi:hypothetical protein